MIEKLKDALADLLVSKEQIDLLAKHWALVQAWNERVNLTAITSDRDAAYLHYRDCLELLPFLVKGAVLDIGSGAGFPGIPLAIVSGARVTLMEPRRKRATFLRDVRAQLGLENVEVHEARALDMPFARFENVVTRATFSDAGALKQCGTWVAPGGRLIAMRQDPGACREIPDRAIRSAVGPAARSEADAISGICGASSDKAYGPTPPEARREGFSDRLLDLHIAHREHTYVLLGRNRRLDIWDL